MLEGGASDEQRFSNIAVFSLFHATIQSDVQDDSSHIDCWIASVETTEREVDSTPPLPTVRSGTWLKKMDDVQTSDGILFYSSDVYMLLWMKDVL